MVEHPVGKLAPFVCLWHAIGVISSICNRNNCNVFKKKIQKNYFMVNYLNFSYNGNTHDIKSLIKLREQSHLLHYLHYIIC